MKHPFIVKVIVIAALPIIASGQDHGFKTKSNTPITIEFGNMKSEKPNLLNMAAYLKSQSGTSNTLAYAGRYVEMVKLANLVGASNLSVVESELILSVPEPAEEILAVLKSDKKKSQTRVDDKIKEIEVDVAKWKMHKLEEEKLAEEKRQAEAKQKIGQDKVDALNRNAAAQERIARSQEELNARLSRY